jgi:hypothetical protein
MTAESWYAMFRPEKPNAAVDAAAQEGARESLRVFHEDHISLAEYCHETGADPETVWRRAEALGRTAIWLNHRYIKRSTAP